jgi:hypothetical protein
MLLEFFDVQLGELAVSSTQLRTDIAYGTATVTKIKDKMIGGAACCAPYQEIGS